MRKIEMQQLLI